MAARFGATIVPFGVIGEDDIAEVLFYLFMILDTRTQNQTDFYIFLLLAVSSGLRRHDENPICE